MPSKTFSFRLIHNDIDNLLIALVALPYKLCVNERDFSSQKKGMDRQTQVQVWGTACGHATAVQLVQQAVQKQPAPATHIFVQHVHKFLRHVMHASACNAMHICMRMH